MMKVNTMKRSILLSAFLLLLLDVMGQAVTETVAIGAGYSNQTWYGLSSGTTTSAPKAEWDIALDLSPQGSSILFNGVTGAMLWAYPHADTAGWATIDTAGIGGWAARWNSDTSWAMGACSRYLNPSNPFDLDWGVYSTLTHYVTGDSLYVVKLASGDYKKLWIRQLATGIYAFTHADLSGANTVDQYIPKSAYAGKTFVYYSLQNDAILDREPAATDWDLLFTQYTAFIPTAYNVTGVLVQAGCEVAQVSGVGDVNTYANWGAATFETPMNGIGYDWKAFTGTWAIEDSLLYFVRKPSGEVWKLVFTGFGGSATGEFQFTKELMNPTAIDAPQAVDATLGLYPNPARGQAAHLYYALEKPCRAAQVTIHDLTGKTVWQQAAAGATGAHVVTLPQDIAQGMYVVRLALDGQSYVRRLVIE
jgi:hypothetical protein